MKEIWKPVKEFEGLYEVSNIGHVRSLDRTVQGRWDVKYFKKGKILCTDILNGYLRVTLMKDNKKHYRYVHKLVAEAFVPNPMEFAYVKHKDNETLHNIHTNLEWISWNNQKQERKYNNPSRLSNNWIRDNEWVVINGERLKAGEFEDRVIKMGYKCNMTKPMLLEFLGMDEKEFKKFVFGKLPREAIEYNYNALKELYDKNVKKMEHWKLKKEGKAINPWKNVNSLFIAPKRAN